MKFVPDISDNLKNAFAKEEIERVKDKKSELLKSLVNDSPWLGKDATVEAREERIRKSRESFWAWDQIYFTPDLYQDGYFKTGAFHKALVDITENHDKAAHIVMGPRNTAKTVTLKKKFIYDFLFGKRKNMAVASETLAPANFFLLDILNFFDTNRRIAEDFEVVWLESSSEQLFAKSSVNPSGSYVDTLSIERSSRGRSRGITYRYDYIFLTDWENNTSSLTPEATTKRIDRINEMRTSLSDLGTLVAEGNNFSVKTAMEHLRLEDEKGVLSPHFKLHIYPAWDVKRGRYPSIWHNRYPAATEEELKIHFKPKDELDWAGNFQQHPIRPEGKIFPKSAYAEYDKLPRDLKVVIWLDPNLSLKSKGDTTAILALGFSATSGRYFIVDALAKSFSESDELLREYLLMRKRCPFTVIATGMDGNVNQESVWSNNILNFTRLHNFPFPYIIFKRYHVDDLTTAISAEWKAGRFLWPAGFAKTEVGETFLNQVFGFVNKAAGKKDDAPDALISAYTLMSEIGCNLMSATGENANTIEVISTRRIKQK